MGEHGTNCKYYELIHHIKPNGPSWDHQYEDPQPDTNGGD
jgi:hypothetical protein